METILTGRGHTLTEFDAEADVYIINTVPSPLSATKSAGT